MRPSLRSVAEWHRSTPPASDAFDDADTELVPASAIPLVLSEAWEPASGGRVPPACRLVRRHRVVGEQNDDGAVTLVPCRSRGPLSIGSLSLGPEDRCARHGNRRTPSNPIDHDDAGGKMSPMLRRCSSQALRT
jgi:hypothetical protein